MLPGYHSYSSFGADRLGASGADFLAGAAAGASARSIEGTRGGVGGCSVFGLGFSAAFAAGASADLGLRSVFAGVAASGLTGGAAGGAGLFSAAGASAAGASCFGDFSFVETSAALD